MKRDLENVTFERETLMSAEAPEGEEMTEEQLDQRYARIAELRSQEMRLQEELTESGEEGRATGDHGEHRTGHRDVDQDPRQQDQGRGVSSVWRELDERLKQHIVGQDEAVDAVSRGHPPQPGGHLPQAQARQLHLSWAPPAWARRSW